MSGECDECGEHASDCTCNGKDKLTIDEICVSEEIQSKLAPIITTYLKSKRPIIDALDWTLTVIVNDEKNDLDVYGHTWERMFTNKINTQDEEFIVDDCICRTCAVNLGAISSKYHIHTQEWGICEFCNEEGNLYFVTDKKVLIKGE